MGNYVIAEQVNNFLQETNVVELTANMQTAFVERDADDNRTDMEILKEELDYLLEMYEDKGTWQNEEYTHAKKLLKETQNGKVIPLDIVTFKPKIPMSDIERARDIVAEKERLKALKRKINN